MYLTRPSLSLPKPPDAAFAQRTGCLAAGWAQEERRSSRYLRIEERELGERESPDCLARDAALWTRPLLRAQQAEELADGMLPLSWMAHARLAIDAVAVAPADSLAR
jgi:hypothetical protein